MKHKNQASEALFERNDEFDPGSIIDTLMNHRVMIAVTTMLFIMMGGLYAFCATPVYRASISIKVEDNTPTTLPDAKDLVRNASSMFEEKSSAEGEMQILRSKSIAMETVDSLKLYIDAGPKRFPVIGGVIARYNDTRLTPGLFGWGGFVWSDEAISVATFEVPKKEEGAGYTVTALSGGQYQLRGPGLEQPVTGRVGVQEQFESSHGPVTLLVSKLDGENGAVFNLTRHSRQQTLEQLQKRLQIDEQGNKSNVLGVLLEGSDPVLVSTVLNEIGKEYVRQNVNQKGANAEKSLNYLELQLPAAKHQMEQAEEAYNAYRNSHGLLDADEEGRLILRQATEADSRLYDLKRQRQDLTARFSPTHPSVAAIDQQIASTNKYVETLASRVRAMPAAEQGALRLMRDMRVSSDMYAALRSNIETLRLVKAGKSASVQLLDTADVPERPVKPVKSLLLLVAAVLGLFIGVGLAFVRDYLFKGVADPEELESRTGLSVYATIPVSDRQDELTRKMAIKGPEKLALAFQYPKDPAVEALRTMRASLQFALNGDRNNVVMLAGPLPGIGKSFLSANLSTLLAAGGKRVLLIDGDLRRGHLNQYFGLQRGPGLADLVAGTRSLEDAVHKNVLPNLDVLQCGDYPKDPAELLLSRHFKETISAVSEQYDIVLLDAPAILAVSDTATMAPVADSIFLVARFADTRAGEISESVKRLAQTGSKVEGILLNGFKVNRGNYAQSRRYGGYAYEAYYSDSVTK
ncbi:tyrosine-protein kinase involved in EPS biosynthesis [Caballeronia choica]|uniref:Putative tyrosine-protein kinase EpsB n=1 Tax=Caballeronia choica TaxID=326476 RepID=A0A158KA87_9BURK|nr:polysaccharide biosynthesis tyrosine autokinase [Caballeronia choica]SAL77633.1 tyrosine-protein kinase involved in EPS biosynthesis [Caballeronia choica]